MLFIAGNGFDVAYGIPSKYGIKKVIHIHNRVGQKLIFGYEKDDEIGLYQNLNFNEMILSFRKDTVSPLKKYNDFFKKLNYTVDEVYSYGFSYGKADSVYIKKIIANISPNAAWYFTEFESDDSFALRIKKLNCENMALKALLVFLMAKEK